MYLPQLFNFNLSRYHGERFAGNESFRNTIDATLPGSFEQLKRPALCFGQKVDVPILHLVILSEGSDEFAANIVEKLLRDEIPVDIRNKRNLTPLIKGSKEQDRELDRELIENSSKLT